MKRSWIKRGTKGFKSRGKPLRKKSRQINWHKKAWDVFSKWIRNRDKVCVTCGSRKDGQAGHYWHGVLDFDEMNINQQCSSCNKWKHGNLAPYGVYLINKHGLEKFLDLEKRHYIALRGEYRTQQDYEEIIKKYQLVDNQIAK